MGGHHCQCCLSGVGGVASVSVHIYIYVYLCREDLWEAVTVTAVCLGLLVVAVCIGMCIGGNACLYCQSGVGGVAFVSVHVCLCICIGSIHGRPSLSVLSVWWCWWWLGICTCMHVCMYEMSLECV